MDFFRKLGLVDKVVEGIESAGLKCAVYDQEINIRNHTWVLGEDTHRQNSFFNGRCLNINIITNLLTLFFDL